MYFSEGAEGESVSYCFLLFTYKDKLLTTNVWRVEGQICSDGKWQETGVEDKTGGNKYLELHQHWLFIWQKSPKIEFHCQVETSILVTDYCPPFFTLVRRQFEMIFRYKQTTKENWRSFTLIEPELNFWRFYNSKAYK